jgi:hypothetical protein
MNIVTKLKLLFAEFRRCRECGVVGNACTNVGYCGCGGVAFESCLRRWGILEVDAVLKGVLGNMVFTMLRCATTVVMRKILCVPLDDVGLVH